MILFVAALIFFILSLVNLARETRIAHQCCSWSYVERVGQEGSSKPPGLDSNLSSLN